MESTDKSTQNCGPDCNCNQPKRKPRWIMILSVVILLAAISIVVIKVVNDRSKHPAQMNAGMSGKSCCSDTSKAAACDTTKKSPCCSKSGN